MLQGFHFDLENGQFKKHIKLIKILYVNTHTSSIHMYIYIHIVYVHMYMFVCMIVCIAYKHTYVQIRTLTYLYVCKYIIHSTYWGCALYPI